MAQANHTYVSYWIAQDGDVEEHPNLFLVKKPIKGLVLGDIQQARLQFHSGKRCL